MDRLCKKGDIIEGPFLFWPSRNNVWDQSEGPSRLSHPWLVLETWEDGGSFGRDAYPSGHRVKAVLLTCKGNDIYNKEDPIHIKFYQTGCFNGIIDKKKITLCREVTIQEKIDSDKEIFIFDVKADQC